MMVICGRFRGNTLVHKGYFFSKKLFFLYLSTKNYNAREKYSARLNTNGVSGNAKKIILIKESVFVVMMRNKLGHTNTI